MAMDIHIRVVPFASHATTATPIDSEYALSEGLLTRKVYSHTGSTTVAVSY